MFFFFFFLFGHLIPTFVLHVELQMKGICLLEKGLRPGCCELIIIITDYIRNTSHRIQSGIRTRDLSISRRPLCHLSYRASVSDHGFLGMLQGHKNLFYPDFNVYVFYDSFESNFMYVSLAFIDEINFISLSK